MRPVRETALVRTAFDQTDGLQTYVMPAKNPFWIVCILRWQHFLTTQNHIHWTIWHIVSSIWLCKRRVTSEFFTMKAPIRPISDIEFGKAYQTVPSQCTSPCATLILLCRYNTAMKLIFLASSFTIIYYMRFHPSVKQTYDAEHDSFKIIFLIGPAAVLALLINQEFSFMEVEFHSNHTWKCLLDFSTYSHLRWDLCPMLRVESIQFIQGRSLWLRHT